MLDVGDGHSMYWIDWGNSKVTEPIFYLHGGPGSGFNESVFQKFNPQTHRVIFHDQRGAGRSTPFGSLDNNTSQHLVRDVNTLREHLGFNKISLYGASWGSTLALLYAIEYPNSVVKMLLSGIFLGRSKDLDYLLDGSCAQHFPEAWEAFIGHFPADKLGDMRSFLKRKILDTSDPESDRFASVWSDYEHALVRLDATEPLPHAILDQTSLVKSRLESHYLLNDCFLPDDFILNQIAPLRSIKQIVIVQGRYDFVCSPAAARELALALGDNCLLHFVQAGHSTSDIVQRETMRAYTNTLWR